MSDDASTAYICIYCPFNSDNLQALEQHMTNAHGCGNQETLSSTGKASKREMSDDEQSPSSLNGLEFASEHSNGVKRLKRASSSLSTHLFLNGQHAEHSDEDDERDSAVEPSSDVTCSTCQMSYPNLAQLIRHGKRKHQIDLSTVNPTLRTLTNGETSESIGTDVQKMDQSPVPSPLLTQPTSQVLSGDTTTDCPYCDFKTIDIEHFKSHIIAHIRDKNYRCLLCNRLYKYRGDCSFHIRRKHHRYSNNFNDYIQRFVFDTSDGGDESMSTQTGGTGSTANGSANHGNSNREQDEPARYFGCPYCDYTSNYGGDVRKHQARKHPHAESKVVKILRQDSEPAPATVSPRVNGFDEEAEEGEEEGGEEEGEDDDDGEDEEDGLIKKKGLKTPEKVSHPSPLPILSNFAPVRVFQCSACHQQGTYKWVVERHIRAKHPDQGDAHVIELPAELSVKLQKITSPLKRFRCSLCSLQSKHSWVVMRHIKHFHTLQTASILDIQPDGKPIAEQPVGLPNGDLSGKSHGVDSESSSISSSNLDLLDRHEGEIDQISSESMVFNYKCSLCDYQSNISWNVQKHLNDKHTEQSNAYVFTQCRQTKISSSHDVNQPKSKSGKQKNGNGQHRSLSPASALAKAKFSPIVEEALLSLQGSRLNPHLYAVQPKFGIKRLKCRHCFYRSNWKTDMIRHVRIRHNLTEPDHHKDMIMMTEQEARSTIELYENTFGKELRRRTFRTWNDWAKAEQEFTPKDGSLQYVGANNGGPASTTDEVKRVKKESSAKIKEEFKPLPNPSNIVSRLLLMTPSPIVHCAEATGDVPLDLSLKASSDPSGTSLDLDDNDDEDEKSTVQYLCSVCPYKHVNWSSVQGHLAVHVTGQGVVCPLCSYSSRSEGSIIRHLKIVHPTSHIPSTFQSTSLNPSAQIIEQHRCSHCSYQCDRSEALDLHSRLEHEQKEEEEEEEEYDIDSSDAEEEEDDDDLTTTNTPNLFECPLCSPSSSELTNVEELTLHVITAHHNQSCPFCSFTTNTSSSQTLIHHVKLHFNGTLIQPDPLLALDQVKELLMLE